MIKLIFSVVITGIKRYRPISIKCVIKREIAYAGFIGLLGTEKPAIESPSKNV